MPDIIIHTTIDADEIGQFNRAQIHDDLRLRAQLNSLGVHDDETLDMIECDRQQFEDELFDAVDRRSLNYAACTSRGPTTVHTMIRME